MGDWATFITDFLFTTDDLDAAREALCRTKHGIVHGTLLPLPPHLSEFRLRGMEEGHGLREMPVVVGAVKTSSGCSEVFVTEVFARAFLDCTKLPATQVQVVVLCEDGRVLFVGWYSDGRVEASVAKELSAFMTWYPDGRAVAGPEYGGRTFSHRRGRWDAP